MDMNVTCNDRERIFEDGTPAKWAALEAHSAACPACAEELRAWKSLSVTAQELRDYSESPALWPRIARTLAEVAARAAQGKTRGGWFPFLPQISMGWQTVLAGAFVLILTLATSWIMLRRANYPKTSDSSLLKSQALQDVE